MTVLVLSFLLVFWTSFNEAALPKQDLYILVMAPWSNHRYDDPAWNIGPALFPAARLAADQINNRSDLLQGYNLRLLERESGCSLTSKTVINLIDASFYSTGGREVIGMVGPGCSESLVVTAQQIRRPVFNFAQLSISFWPENGNEKYRNSFQVVSPAATYVEAFVSLMELAEWEKIIVVYDNRNAAYSQVFYETRKRIDSSRMYPIELQAQTQHDYIFREAETRNVRIILVLTGLRAAQNIVCDNSGHKNFQLIFVDMVHDDVLNLDLFQHSQCTFKELERSLNNTIFLTNNFQRSDTGTSHTFARMSYQAYEKLYNKYLDAYLQEIAVSRENLPFSGLRYNSAYYDSVWALAIALNKSLAHLNGTTNNTKLGYHVRRNLESVHLEGMSGLLHFNKTSRAIPNKGVIINQSTVVSSGKWEFHTGNYISEKTNFNGTYFHYLPYKTRTLVYHVDERIGFTILAIPTVAVVFFFVLQAMFLSLKVKAISPQLDYLILSGCCLYLVALVLSTLQAVFPNRLENYHLIFGIGCNLQHWCLSVAFTLIFGTICAKTWRIYRIFSYFKQGRVKYVSDPFLISIIISLVIVDFIYLMVWTLTDPWILAKWNRREGALIVDYHYCFCNQIKYWLAPLLIQKLVLIFVAVILSILVRPVKREGFKNTKAILILIYLLIIIHIVGLSVYALLESLQTLYLLKFLSYSLTLVLTLVTISMSQFVTHMWPILYRKMRLIHTHCPTHGAHPRTHFTPRKSSSSAFALTGF